MTERKRVTASSWNKIRRNPPTDSLTNNMTCGRNVILLSRQTRFQCSFVFLLLYIHTHVMILGYFFGSTYWCCLLYLSCRTISPMSTVSKRLVLGRSKFNRVLLSFDYKFWPESFPFRLLFKDSTASATMSFQSYFFLIDELTVLKLRSYLLNISALTRPAHFIESRTGFSSLISIFTVGRHLIKILRKYMFVILSRNTNWIQNRYRTFLVPCLFVFQNETWRSNFFSYFSNYFKQSRKSITK